LRDKLHLMRTLMEEYRVKNIGQDAGMEDPLKRTGNQKNKKQKRVQFFMMTTARICDRSIQISRDSKGSSDCEALLEELDELIVRCRKVLKKEAFLKLAEEIFQGMDEKMQLLQKIKEVSFEYKKESEKLGFKDTKDGVFLSQFVPKTTMKDFEMVAPIATGGFGKVFLARKIRTHDIYCIKVISKASLNTRNQLRMQREQNIMTTTHNPFVVQLFYSFQSKANLFLVMEYMVGGDLASLLDRLGSLPEDAARIYTAEIALALEYLHSIGIAHRDIKPANVLISITGHIKLADFGLATHGTPIIKESTLGCVHRQPCDNDPSMKRPFAKSCVGTPEYMSPEIVTGEGHSVTVDWWALGVLLFELISGTPPFTSTSLEEIFDQVVFKSVPWELLPQSSPEVLDVLAKLLEKDPTKRLGYNSPQEVKDHPFFISLDWTDLLKQEPPFVPEAKTDDFLGYIPTTETRPGSIEDIMLKKDECAGLGNCEACQQLDCEEKVKDYTFKNILDLHNKMEGCSK